MINDPAYADRLEFADPDALETPTEMWKDSGRRHVVCGKSILDCSCPRKGFGP